MHQPFSRGSKKPAEVVVTTRLDDRGNRRCDARIVSIRRGVIPLPMDDNDAMSARWGGYNLKRYAKAWAKELGLALREETRL